VRLTSTSSPEHNALDFRLSWDQRFARNARPSTASALEVMIHGLPATFANVFGFGLVNLA